MKDRTVSRSQRWISAATLPLLMFLFMLLALPVLHAGSEAKLQADHRTPAMSADEVAARLKQGPSLYMIDVRKPAEFAVAHIPGAVNIPLLELELRSEDIPPDQDVLVYCINGPRTRQAEYVLIENGVSRLFHLKGGFQAWIRQGLPVEKGA